MRLSALSLLAGLPLRSAVRRGVFALILACSSSLALAWFAGNERARSATERLNSAADRLESLTDGDPIDDSRSASVAWGYSARLQWGMDSPFRLIESAARDPRLTPDERRTVAEALLGRVLAGESHRIDAAALDLLGPAARGTAATGEQHLALIALAVGAGSDPRAGELGVRMAYTLAATERLVQGHAPGVVAGAAALLADREIARREARAVVRADADPIAEVGARRARRAFYAERPALLGANDRLERDAVEIARWVLDSLRRMAPEVSSDFPIEPDSADVRLARQLTEAGRAMPPAGPLAVTVQRYLPVARAARGVDEAVIARARNGEMLVAAARLQPDHRAARRAVGRIMLSAAVAMRSQAQDAVWFPGDSAPTRQEVAAAAGVAEIAFDADVPRAWRPYYLKQFAGAVADLRRVMPAVRLDAVHVRFRMTSPADSALAMHDPRTRTLHLPVVSAAGTLTHEIAHELDRQSAIQQGHLGYRSDWVARNGATRKGKGPSSSVSASLRALTEEVTEAPRARAKAERPAEIFATQVDWFVASALASRGISSGFLSAVQDELLTGHVVHPERLRTGARGHSLTDALSGMTAIAPFALEARAPGTHAVLRWALSGTVDDGVASAILRERWTVWSGPTLDARDACEPDDPKSALVRMAAESRARGWLSARARTNMSGERPEWVRAALGEGPWADDIVDRRVARLRDHILLELSNGALLPSGLAATGAALASQARC